MMYYNSFKRRYYTLKHIFLKCRTSKTGIFENFLVIIWDGSVVGEPQKPFLANIFEFAIYFHIYLCKTLVWEDYSADAGKPKLTAKICQFWPFYRVFRPFWVEKSIYFCFSASYASILFFRCVTQLYQENMKI